MNQSARERALVGAVLAVALSTIACGSAHAAPMNTPARVSIASPTGGQAVAGSIPVAIAFDAGPSFGRITAVSLWVDDSLYLSRGIITTGPRGTDYLDLDTRRLANGQHVIKVVAHAGKQVVASDDCIVNVSNGGLDSIAPLVSFRNLMDGDVVSGTFDLEVNAVDNDQVQVVSIFVNRWPVLIKSSAPYSVPVDTTRYQDQTGKATLKLEAWAYDRANNLGKARPITIQVDNQPNATPMKRDPASNPEGVAGPVSGSGISPMTGRSLPQGEVEQPGLVDRHGAAGRESAARAVQPESSRPTTGRTPTRPGELASPSFAGSAPVAAQLAGRRDREPARKAEAGSRPAVSGQPVRMASGGAPQSPEVVPSGRTGIRMVDGPRSSMPSDAPARGTSLPDAKAVRLAGVGGRAPEILPSGSIDVKGASTPRSTEPALGSAGAQRSTPPVINRLVVSLAPAGPSEPVQSPMSVPAPPKRSESRSQKSRSSEPLIFAWDPSSRPTDSGRYAMRVFRGRTSPYPRASAYTVQRGDTLRGIARAHKVTPRSILVASGLKDAARLRIGAKLQIPGTFDVLLNDQRIAFDVAPRIDNGMPIAPFRQIMEYAGGMVLWYPETQTVRGINEQVEIELQIGRSEARVNQKSVTLDRAPFIDSGRTMVPVRFVEEALDLKAEYDVRTGSIYLLKK
jgi:LysM repeat protein